MKRYRHIKLSTVYAESVKRKPRKWAVQRKSGKSTAETLACMRQPAREGVLRCRASAMSVLRHLRGNSGLALGSSILHSVGLKSRKRVQCKFSGALKKNFFYWSRVDLQCCASLCCAAQWSFQFIFHNSKNFKKKMNDLVFIHKNIFF